LNGGESFPLLVPERRQRHQKQHPRATTQPGGIPDQAESTLVFPRSQRDGADWKPLFGPVPPLSLYDREFSAAEVDLAARAADMRQAGEHRPGQCRDRERHLEIEMAGD
jgi:hypothetical protein